MGKIVLFLGHPDEHSYCAALAEAYAAGAQSAGGDIELIYLSKLQFDPVMHYGYRQKQELEPDLQRAQNAIKEAKHVVFVYPHWWGSMPALMKGFIDRVFLPHFAFRYVEGKAMPEKLLTGRTGEIWMTADSPRFWLFLGYGDMPTKVVKNAILRFCGIDPVKVNIVGNVRGLKEPQLKAHLESARQAGVRAAKSLSSR